jgi:hypothetical protein
VIAKDLVPVAQVINLTMQQKLNIQILCYHQAIKGETYNAEDIYNLWPTDPALYHKAGKRPSITAIQQYKSTQHFRSGMAERGIEVEEAETLTQEQIACISLLTNMSDRRSLGSKLKALGIKEPKYRGWLKQKKFNDAIRGIAGRGLEEAIPLAEVALSNAAVDGDLHAIKFLMEVTGRYNPSQQQAIDAQALIAVMVDAAQEVLGNDPEKLRQYTDIVRLKAQTIKGVVL